MATRAEREQARAARVARNLAQAEEPAEPAQADGETAPVPVTPVRPAELVGEPAEGARENPLPPPPPPPVPEARRSRGRPPGARARGKQPEPDPGALPADPEEADRVLAPLRVQAGGYVHLVDAVCCNVPPRLALVDQERDALRESIALVLHKYGGQVDPWIGLGVTLLAIGVTRYVVYARERRSSPPIAAPPAGAA